MEGLLPALLPWRLGVRLEKPQLNFGGGDGAQDLLHSPCCARVGQRHRSELLSSSRCGGPRSAALHSQLGSGLGFWSEVTRVLWSCRNNGFCCT